jgi:hypothetical protein
MSGPGSLKLRTKALLFVQKFHLIFLRINIRCCELETILYASGILGDINKYFRFFSEKM